MAFEPDRLPQELDCGTTYTTEFDNGDVEWDCGNAGGGSACPPPPHDPDPAPQPGCSGTMDQLMLLLLTSAMHQASLNGAIGRASVGAMGNILALGIQQANMSSLKDTTQLDPQSAALAAQLLNGGTNGFASSTELPGAR